MLLNYLKLAVRLLIRNPFYTTVNILGLSVGFAVFFVLWQYSEAELATDQFHEDANRIYRFGTVFKWYNDKAGWQYNQQSVNHPEIVREFAANQTTVEDFTRVFNRAFFSKRIMNHDRAFTISYVNQRGEKSFFKEERFVYADPNVFAFFGLPVVSGNPYEFLNDANTAVISERFAKKYFGKQEAVGQMLFINDSIPLQITGIFKNLPNNTHLSFEIVASTASIKKQIEGRGFTSGAHSYYKIKQGTDIDQMQRKANQYFKENWKHLVDPRVKIDFELYLQPLAELPFSQFDGDFHRLRSKQTLIFFKAIAVAILLMAWINYINLTISAHAKRIKELAARKMVGALSSDFVKQFFIESALINILALSVAVTLIQIIRYPLEVYFLFYTPFWSEISFSTAIILSTLPVTGIVLTAFYPALVSLKRAPKTLLRSVKIKTNETVLSKILTTVQYTSAIVLIIWTFSVFRQINFILRANMGIDQKNVVVVDAPVNLKNSGQTIDFFLQRISSIPGLNSFTTSSSVVGDEDWGWANLEFPETALQYGAALNGGVDEIFIPFYDLKLVAGRNFLPEYPADRNAIILSEILIDKLGIPPGEKAIGNKVRILVNQETKEWKTCEIIGVLAGYRLRPLFTRHGTSESSDINDRDHLALTYKNYLLPYLSTKKISLRIEPKAHQQTIASIQKLFKETFPADIFNWYFLDEFINAHYHYEKIARNQLLLFTGLSVLIACLGLLGMINNKAIEKTKEIGIRKILGAKLLHITNILFNSTSKQILISAVLGLPLAKYIVNSYFENFEKQIPFNAFYFLSPILIFIGIMIITISSVLWKAARINPAESLRYE